MNAIAVACTFTEAPFSVGDIGAQEDVRIAGAESEGEALGAGAARSAGPCSERDVCQSGFSQPGRAGGKAQTTRESAQADRFDAPSTGARAKRS